MKLGSFDVSKIMGGSSEITKIYLGTIEVYTSVAVGGFSATGGEETIISEGGFDYKVHTFTSSGDFTVTSEGEVEYLVVAGGGGGSLSANGIRASGGGGAGGYLTSTALNLSLGTKTITVGTGGLSGSSTTTGNGTNSSIDALIVAIGGGRGGYGENGAHPGFDGGSGGGAGAQTGAGGVATIGQGNDGGVAGVGLTRAGAGGGGYTQVGGDAGSSSGGAGGAGISSTFSGISTEYAAGGGGGPGGIAGGSTAGAGDGSSALTNSGSGGGGISGFNNGGAGGSGIVIIRYKVMGYFVKYKVRVEADYGIIEDGSVLLVEVVDDTNYSNALAIYNPNGGHKPGKIYDIRDTDNTLPNDLTVTGGGGTRINKLGQLERIEGTGLNMIPRTIDFTTWGIYSSSLTLTTDATTPPPNFQNGASLIVEASGGDYHQITVPTFYTTVGIFTFSVFVKFRLGDTRNIGISPVNAGGSGGNATAVFNPNGEYVGTAGSPALIAYTTTPVGDGWHRISATLEKTAANNSGATIRFSDGLNITYLGGGTSGVYIYGPQFEPGSVATPYKVKTSTAAFPKIDYGSGKTSFLIEPASTNYITFSEDFDNSLWVKSSATIGAYVTSPTGEENARIVNLPTSSHGLYIKCNMTIAGGQAVTTSVYMRATAETTVKIYYNGATNGANNSFTKNVVITTEWQRYEYTALFASDSGCFTMFKSGIGSDISIEMFGAQTELISTPTSYIPTNGSVVTRTRNFYSVDDIINSFPKTFKFNIQKLDLGGVVDVLNTNPAANALNTNDRYYGIHIMINGNNDISVQYGSGTGNGATSRKTFSTSTQPFLDGLEHDVVIECLDFNTVNLLIDGQVVGIPYLSGTAGSINFGNQLQYLIGHRSTWIDQSTGTFCRISNLQIE